MDICIISLYLLVDGGWSEWISSSECAGPCGTTATQTWSRTCNSPAPQNEGEECQSLPSDTYSIGTGGDKTEYQERSCDTQPCPISKFLYSLCYFR